MANKDGSVGVPRVFRPSRGTAALEDIAKQHKSIAQQVKSSKRINYISLGVSIAVLIVSILALLHAYSVI